MLCLTISAQQRRFTIADGLHNNEVRQIVELPNGQILVSNEGAFSVYDGSRFQPVSCCIDSIYHLPSFGCHDYVWVNDSVLLLKDFYSMYIFDAITMQFRYDYSTFVNNGKVKAFMNSAVPQRPSGCTDRQGGKWMVDDMNGIIYHSPFPVRGNVIPLESLASDDNIRHVCCVGDTEMLMASAGGIYLFSPGSDMVTKVLATGEIHCANINKGADGEVWLSTKQGLYRYSGGTLQSYNVRNTSGFLHDHMRFAYALDNDRVLVCNLLHFLGYFYPESGKYVMLNDKVPELNGYRTMIDACPIDDSGRVLVATQNGAFVLNTSNDKIEHPDYLNGIAKYSNKFNCLLRDSHKRVWIGSQNGLFVLVPQLTVTGNNKSFKLHHLSCANGLSNACVKSLVEDASGNVFVATAYGINKVSIGTDDMKVTSYGVSDGVPALEICERSMCMMPNGKLYFSTKESLVAFDAVEHGGKKDNLDVRLVGVEVNDSLWTWCEELDLEHDQNNITLRFSALNYACPSHTRYRYRLKGISNVWMEVKDGKDIVVANYHTLPSGHYVFEIQATLDNEAWGPVTSFYITVHPPLWLTWWAIMSYMLIGILVSAKIFNIYFNHRKKVMEAENENRINKLFELRSQANYQFAQNTNAVTEKLVDSSNEELIERMNKAIADNMDNCNYTVDDLASDLGTSRASLYKKAQQALGITPNDYMRNVRLKHATTLLEQGLPVNQVSLMVGFMTPRYFSQCFKNLFGVSPSEYSDKARGEK